MNDPKFKNQVINTILGDREKCFFSNQMFVDLKCKTNTKTTTNNEVDDEVDDATTNEFYARKNRLIQLMNIYPEVKVILYKL